MKKVYIMLGILLMLTMQLFSQSSRNIKWVGVTLLGEYGVANLFNYAVENDPNITQTYINPNYGFGGKVGVTFGSAYDLSVEFVNHTFQQKYDVRPLTGGTFTKKLKFNTTDIALLFRYTSFAGVYIEVGPRFSTLNSADCFNTLPYETTTKVDSIYKPSMINLTAGVGFVLYSSMNDRFRVNFGLRASYALDDLMADPARPIVEDELYQPNYQYTYDTNLFTITAKLELVFYPAYYGKAGCGKSRWVFF